MRKYIQYLLFLIPVISIAQNELPPDSNKKKKKKENYDLFRDVSIIDHPHEIKFDVLSLALNGRIHLSYEFQHKMQWYYGLGISYQQNTNRKDNFNHDNFHYLPKFDVTPYVRYALTDDQKKFYFVEVFTSINNGKYKNLERVELDQSAIYKIKHENYTDIAIGLAGGFKVLVKKRFIIDAYAGGGINLMNEKSPKYIPRFGANIGYCF